MENLSRPASYFLNSNKLPPSPTSGLPEHAQTLVSEAEDVFKSQNTEKKKRHFCEMVRLQQSARLPALSQADIRNKLQSLSENRAFVRLDLAGVNLEGCDLTNLNLSHANLTNANLSSTFLNSAILTGANLTNAKVTRSIVFKTDLRNAILDGTNFANTDTQFAYMNNLAKL